jgi:hypothetical protein
MSRSASADPQPRPVAAPGDANFTGKLKALSISDVLEFLRVLNRCGVLILSDGSREVSLGVREGKILWATSTGPEGSPAHCLLREGQITRDQFEVVVERENQGERVNRALIELGILTPKDLWEALRSQARSIVLELFAWERGEFLFREGEGTVGSGLELDLPVLDLIAEGIRGVRDTRLFAQRLPSDSWVFEALEIPERKTSAPLEPHEAYVLKLIDGSRSLSEVNRASEIGKAETLRVVFLLFSVGYLRMKATPVSVLPSEPQDGEALTLIRRYNEMFAFLHRYLAREVGPIGEAVLGRYFEDQKKDQAALLCDARLARDGTLDERTLVRNLSSLQNGGRSERLIDGLNELLYAEILAVRRTLGVSHEGRAIQGLRDLGLQPVTRIESASEEAEKR